MGLLGDIAGGVLGAANTLYNIHTNERDFDYQKALQQQIFEREDTAVQRRAADLQAAGMNQNLAAGSSAGAGSVVSRSNTNDINMGSALDMIQAVNNIRQQKQQTENAKVENSILQWENRDKKLNTTVNLMSTLHSLGFDITPTFNNGNLNFKYSSENMKNNKLFQNIDFNNQNLRNTADLLQKDVDFYDADKFASYLLPLLRLGTGRR